MTDIREVDKTYFPLYDEVSQNVEIKSEYIVKRINNGLGGFVIEEKSVDYRVKDLGKYERAMEFEKQFDISNWRFYMAFDGETPIGAMTVAGPTKGLDLLQGRNDACILWDIRVADNYKHMGVGQRMFDLGVKNAKSDGYKMMMIECQNNNVTACNFYKKQGALLDKMDMHAYDSEPGCEGEVQFIWYLKLQ